MNNISYPKMLRSRGHIDSGKVSFIELFFDLVFVFAITQLSHSLLEDISWSGALHTSILTMAVWWAWNYTTGQSDWLNPDALPTRFMLIALMHCRSWSCRFRFQKLSNIPGYISGSRTRYSRSDELYSQYGRFVKAHARIACDFIRILILAYCLRRILNMGEYSTTRSG